MNPDREFMCETFHALAQPITALRANIELGLGKHGEQAAIRVLEDCLPLIDRLMQDLAVLREIASLDEPPALDSCEGRRLLQSSVEEMATVAQAGGIAIHLDPEPGAILCHAPMFQRAIFLLLDEIISGAGRNRTISISLRRREDEFLLEIRPGTPPGPRQKLCRKLMQFAGGCVLDSAAGNISATFRECSYQRPPATADADKRLLTSH
jgi:signal transduction histidine kinase